MRTLHQLTEARIAAPGKNLLWSKFQLDYMDSIADRIDHLAREDDPKDRLYDLSKLYLMRTTAMNEIIRREKSEQAPTPKLMKDAWIAMSRYAEIGEMVLDRRDDLHIELRDWLAEANPASSKSRGQESSKFPIRMAARIAAEEAQMSAVENGSSQSSMDRDASFYLDGDLDITLRMLTYARNLDRLGGASVVNGLSDDVIRQIRNMAVKILDGGSI